MTKTKCHNCVHFEVEDLADPTPGKAETRMSRYTCHFLKKAHDFAFQSKRAKLPWTGEHYVPERHHVLDADACPRFHQAKGSLSPRLSSSYRSTINGVMKRDALVKDDDNRTPLQFAKQVEEFERRRERDPRLRAVFEVPPPAGARSDGFKPRRADQEV